MERMDTRDWLKVIQDMTLLISKLENELTMEQKAHTKDVEELHARYGQKLQNLKDTLGDREGSTDVPKTDQ